MTNPYPSMLLNDLHHYFPDLLYHPDQFQSVQDVLGYIIRVARQNPYDRERAAVTATAAATATTISDEMKQPYEFHGTAATATAATATAATATAATAATTTATASSNPLNEAEQLLQALFQRRSPIIRPSANRFRISMPLDMPNHYSMYSSRSPDILQALSQFSSELMRPVIVRPTEEELARNTYLYCSDVAHNENCSICQEPMEAQQETRTILACSHCFHRECIDTWFQEHVQCPTCRHDVRES